MNRYSDQPDIMAIGDSMYQGIRSLSFLPTMVQHSAPKQVADALEMVMVVPDLQRPLLFDLEKQIRDGGLLHLVENIRDICLQELPHWPFDQPWSQHEAFDNIAVGGATINSLLNDTDANNRDKVMTLSATLARTNRLTSAERMVFIVILLDFPLLLLKRASIALRIHMASSAQPKSRSHACVTFLTQL